MSFIVAYLVFRQLSIWFLLNDQRRKLYNLGDVWSFRSIFSCFCNHRINPTYWCTNSYSKQFRPIPSQELEFELVRIRIDAPLTSINLLYHCLTGVYNQAWFLKKAPLWCSYSFSNIHFVLLSVNNCVAAYLQCSESEHKWKSIRTSTIAERERKNLDCFFLRCPAITPMWHESRCIVNMLVKKCSCACECGCECAVWLWVGVGTGVLLWLGM